MGRFVFTSKDLAATTKTANGRTAGTARCRVYVMDPAENAFGPEFSGSMRNLRRQLRSDGSLAVSAPKPGIEAPDAVIPAQVFAGVPDAALVNFQWEFIPRPESPS